MSVEAGVVVAWLQSVLEDPTGLFLYEGGGRGEDEQLICEMARSNVGPRAHSQGSRAWMDYRFEVKAIVADDELRANQLADIIDDEIENQVNQPGPNGGTIYHSLNEGDIRYEERDGDRQFFHRGALYFIRARRT